MAFDNEYPNRKDRRARYYGAAAYVRACRCNGSCNYCRGSRTHHIVRQAPVVSNSTGLLTASMLVHLNDMDNFRK